MMLRIMTDFTGTWAFFGPRAADWEDRFPDDGPEFERAIAELRPATGGVVVDVGCGTGRALPAMRAAVGPAGRVFGIDVTAEMLGEAARRGRDRIATLVLADAMALPFPDDTVDAVFASGLVTHLPDPVAGLREFARVGNRNARLALFHPVGRVALAAKQGRTLSPDDVRAPDRIRGLLTAAGWRCELVDDAPERYLVLAVRD